jgi:hypothetical protein
MTGVVLPDGTTWRFDYDNSGVGYADLMAVYPPTGGHISYTWTTTPHCHYMSTDVGYRTVATRTVFDGANSNKWTYNLGPSYVIYTVTDPLGNDSAYSFDTDCSVTQIQYYSGLAASGTLLKTVVKGYRTLPNPFPGDMGLNGPKPKLLASTTTTWPNGQQSQVQFTYDSGFTFTDTNKNHNPYGQTYTSSYGLVTLESHYNYGNGAPGPVLSTTNTSYLALSNAPNASSYLAANILDLPSSVVVTDGSGNKCAETDYGYDESAADSSGVTEQHVAAPNSVRGNLTSLTRQLFTSPCSSANPSMSPLKTTYHVYDTVTCSPKTAQK